MKNTLKKRIISVLLTLSLLSGASLFAFAQDDLVIDSSDNAILNDLTTDEEDDYTPRYVEDEVIIMLADTPETENLQLYSVYSDDYQTLNLEATEKVNASRSAYALNSVAETVTVAGSVNAIEDILDLGIEITEMKMLNPQSEDERVNTVSVSRSATATNTNEKVYTVNEENNNVFSIKFEDLSVGEVISTLSNNPIIEIIEPNYIYEYCDTSNIYVNPNQYSLNAIHAPWAWYTTTGSQSVSVGVIDTGIDATHPDLADNIWSNPYYIEGEGCSVCSRTDDIHGYSFTGAGTTDKLPCGGVPFDPDGHGTHVAGIIGARSSNPTKGVSGVCPYVSLVWLGCSMPNYDGISNSAVIEAVTYADNHNIDILNASIGGAQYSRILENRISNYDGLFVAAAGNEDNDNDENPVYPACLRCPNIISVAASDENNNLAIFPSNPPTASNYGVDSVHVVAPGSNIYSTMPGGKYGSMYGTSQATPHITGIAALLKSFRPSYTSQMLKAAICYSTQSLGKTYNIIHDGGIVDAYAALNIHPGLLRSVTFDNNYNSHKPPFVDYVLTGNKVQEPAMDSVRYDDDNEIYYMFKGWYTSPDGGQLFDFDTLITSNTTVYAQWEEIIEEETYLTEFTDANFRELVLNYLNESDRGDRTEFDQISVADKTLMSAKTEWNINKMGIRDLTGINYFTGLLSLDCSNNELYSLDISKLTRLEELDCSSNGIRNIKFGGSCNLRIINCWNNELLGINMNLIPLVEELDCSMNLLSALSIPSSSNLVTLNCSFNNLTSLCTNGAVYLKTLNCKANKLSMITLDDLPSLEDLKCEFNYLSSLSFNSLPSLISLNCNNNYLTDLDISTLSSLESFVCHNNDLISLTIGSLPLLEIIYCYNNSLTILTLENLPSLKELYCYNNDLSILSLGSLPSLEILKCANNNLSSLSVLHLKSLNTLECNNNNLTVLYATHLQNLTTLNCRRNQITLLNVACSGLTKLNCSNNEITKLKIVGCKNLKELKCHNNRLTILNIYGLENLEYVEAHENDFNSITDIFCNENIDMSEILAFHNQKLWIENPFSDIPYNIKAVQYVYENGLIEGVTLTSFFPHDIFSRVEFAEVLYNMANNPAIEATANPFTDFDNITYADSYNAVMWAYSNGFIEPTTATTFNPEGAVTREMAALALYRYADEYDIPLADIREYTAFADESSISANALTAVQEMYEACLINPTSVDDETGAITFSPNATLTRIDTAVLIRLFEVCRLYL